MPSLPCLQEYAFSNLDTRPLKLPQYIKRNSSIHQDEITGSNALSQGEPDAGESDIVLCKTDFLPDAHSPMFHSKKSNSAPSLLQEPFTYDFSGFADEVQSRHFAALI